MIVRFYQGWFQVLTIDLPLFLASTCSISSFYLAAERAFYPKTWKRTFLYLPFVMALGIGLSVRNALAVVEAILGKKSEFVRTPKYKVEASGKNRDAWVKKSYNKSAGLMPYLEIALGVYFASAVLYSIQMENYATVPFFILFIWGYLYTGLMSLAQTHIDRLMTMMKEAFASIHPERVLDTGRAAVVLGGSDANLVFRSAETIVSTGEAPIATSDCVPETRSRAASCGSSL
jgi:hypothetical protein